MLSNQTNQTNQTSKMILPATPEDRRLLALHSPLFFDVYYCGMRYATHREKWLKTFDKVRKISQDQGDKGRLLVLAPRDHGKTEVGVTYALRAICLDRNIRILWICASSAQAERRMRRVKELLKSPRIVEDWASDPSQGCLPFEGGDESWTQNQLYVQRTKHSVDATLQAIGSGGAITGAHFDIILADDLEDDKTTYSAAGREKTRRWFKGTVQPMLSRGGIMIVIGTRKHHDDLYGHLIVDPTWTVIQNPAISQWPESYSFKLEVIEGKEMITGVEVKGEAKVLWPEERPFTYLVKERRTMGEQIFSREFLNQVQDDSAAAFKWEWLEYAKQRGKNLSLYEIPPIDDLDIVQGWDFSLVQSITQAEAKDTDFTVGTTWARDRSTGDHYLLGLFRKRGLSPTELRQSVLSEYSKFKGKVYAVAVERNAFGEIHFVGLQTSTDLPLRPHLTTGAKKASPWEGVPSLSVLFENRKVIIPSATNRDNEITTPLINELWGLGREKHDDTVMSLWIAHCVLREQRFSHRIAFGNREYGSEEEIKRLENEDQGDSVNRDLRDVLASWGVDYDDPNEE